ncbi:hypothetical protein [Pararhodobacter zhoushanensis]|uniref:Uncharacterized protein n=1 Tax=Pararhodobacter zhoushanensis TaxID=2479545 RepID=A0ABT3H3F4_9RHOB|nr:hypothetical protein [Pararhodobacter zhoushanensis]MCW1934355.1 hypothetical protein [Pararhodobacter zhoushanensis]
MKTLALTLIAATVLSVTTAHAEMDASSPCVRAPGHGAQPSPQVVFGDGSVRTIRR